MAGRTPKHITIVTRIFHICQRDSWAEAEHCGEYRAANLEIEGFIHCSTEDQVAGTANLLFHGQQGLVLLAIESDRVTAQIKFEEASNGLIFPHIYGPLNLDTVVGNSPFEPGEDGAFTFA